MGRAGFPALSYLIPLTCVIRISMSDALFQPKARLLRKVSGSINLEITLRKAVKALSFRGIPSLVVGGFAVQERGYPRFTSDVDLVVPNVAEALECLSISGFKQNQGSNMTLTDRSTKVEVGLLPGGWWSIGRDVLMLPTPVRVSTTPIIVDLKTLSEIKLSSYMGAPVDRVTDFADVVELVKANELPRDFPLHPVVMQTYQTMWDNLQRDRMG